MWEKTYLCIDLKSFYASVECVERNLDPLHTNLVVADPERSKKTICLAITPPMKKLGISSRCRLFEIPDNIKYIIAPPRMQLYIDYSAEIYGIYLKYVGKEDIHVYSIDEAFFDVTDYLGLYQMTAEELGQRILQDVYRTTGITATCGVGSNLYLAKVALDITAKHVENNISVLDEKSYCETLWNYRPITDFWRVGAGIARRLESIGIQTMGEIATADENVLYQLLGVDAELLIDHAWGREPVTMEEIKSYRPKKNSVSSGQVLSRDYSYEEGLLVVKEMADSLSLELVERGLVTDSVSLRLGYARQSGRSYDKGTTVLDIQTNSSRCMIEKVQALYQKIADRETGIRRVVLTCNNVMEEYCQQYHFFINIEELERERKLQTALVSLKKKYGKNIILKGMDLVEAATTIERNQQIGGHKSGA